MTSHRREGEKKDRKGAEEAERRTVETKGRRKGKKSCKESRGES